MIFTKITKRKKQHKKRLIKQNQAHYIRHKEEARKLIHKKITQINSYYNYTYNRIAIKNNKTNWGSCSSKKNLNFNYKILFLPEELQDYIITHELCHLKELNHSQKFWYLVAQTIPNYKSLRKQLRSFSNKSLR